MINNNLLEQGLYSKTTTIVVIPCNNFPIYINTLEEYNGLAVQLSFSESITINWYNQRFFDQTLYSTPTDKTITLTTSQSARQYSLCTNGHFKQASILKNSDCKNPVLGNNVLSISNNSNFVLDCDYQFSKSLWVLNTSIKTRGDFAIDRTLGTMTKDYFIKSFSTYENDNNHLPSN